MMHTVGIEPCQLTSTFNNYKRLKPCGPMLTIITRHVIKLSKVIKL